MSSRHAPRGRIKGTDPIDGTDPMKARCKATNRQGKRCGKAPILGGTVCRMHGGAAPQVKEAAKARIERLADGPALDCLEQLISPEMRAQFPSTALGASRYLVDRKHGTPTESVDMNVSGQVDIISVLRQRHARREKLKENAPVVQAGNQ